MSAFDWVIVGAGITGCTLAERLSAAGRSVCLVEQRGRVGGNCSDRTDDGGVRIGEYGPHFFHTDSDAVFGYLSRFTRWRQCELRVLGDTGRELLPVPVNKASIRAIVGAGRAAEAIGTLTDTFGDGATVRISALLAERRIRWIGEAIWEAVYSAYSAKQWGRWLGSLDDEVFARVPVRLSDDDRHFTERHQGLPRHGYQAMFEAMLSHNPGVELLLGESFAPEKQRARLGVVFTGPIDAFFNHRFGHLPYRSVRFEFVSYPSALFVQRSPIVNHLSSVTAATRSTEFRQLTGQFLPTTTVCREYPYEAGEGDTPMYPVPSRQSTEMLGRYRDAARRVPNVHFCGRLGTYHYLDMDDAVAQALMLAEILA